jgi:hypothetical protein
LLSVWAASGGEESGVDEVKPEAESRLGAVAEPTRAELDRVLVDVGHIDAQMDGDDIGADPARHLELPGGEALGDQVGERWKLSRELGTVGPGVRLGHTSPFERHPARAPGVGCAWALRGEPAVTSEAREAARGRLDSRRAERMLKRKHTAHETARRELRSGGS